MINASKTCHSETGKIKTLFLKNIQQSFIGEDHIKKHWSSLNYLEKPDYQTAMAEYETFESILKDHGAEIFYLPFDPAVNMDSVYCRDAAISTNKGMVICNMGKAERRNEPAALKAAFESNRIPILGSIMGKGTIEGGDVAWLDENTLAVGHTYRTNEEGISQLITLLKPLNVEIITAQLPHYKGPTDVFHLMSILSPVDKDLAVVYSPLMPVAFRNRLLNRGYQLVEVPDEEFETMGCNVLALGPRLCLMVEGNDQTKAALERAGCQVIVYKGREISHKGGGGPTCLTRPIERFS